MNAVIESGVQTRYESTLPSTDIGKVSAHSAAYIRSIPDLSQANFTERNAYGDSYYPRSCHRQWLNSDGKAVKAGDSAFSYWWTPQSVFDMPPAESVRKLAGFLHGLDPELRAVMGKATVKVAKPACDCADPSVPEYETLNDPVFALSLTEVYGESNNTIAEGSQLALWSGTADAAKIKAASSGTAVAWYLRSCLPTVAYAARLVLATGAPSYGMANGTNGVVPGLIIKSKDEP